MWRSFLFPTRTVGTLKKNNLKISITTKTGGFFFLMIKTERKKRKLTESFQPGLAACREETSQPQN